MDFQRKTVGEDTLSLSEFVRDEVEELYNEEARSTNQVPSKHAEAIPRGDSDHASADGVENDSVDDDASDSEDVSEQEDLPAISLQPTKAPGTASKTGKRQAVIKRQKKTTTHATELDQDKEDHQSSEDLPHNATLTKKVPRPASKTRRQVAKTKPSKTVSTKGEKQRTVVSKGMESYSDEEDDIDDYEPRKVPETKTSAKARQPVAQKVKHKMDSNSDSEDFKKSAAASKKSKVVSARTKKPVRAESDDEPETVPKMKPKVLEDKTMRGYSKPKDYVPSGRNLRSRITKNKPSKTESSGDEAKGTKSTSRRTIKTEPNKSESEEEQTDVPPVEKRRKKNVSQKSKSKSTLIKKRLSSTRLSIAMAVENKKRPSIKDMVLAAVTALQTERNAVSLPVLKKFIYETYQISPDYQSTYITKAVAKAVENGELINTTGSGANGSFKLGKVVKMKDASSSKKYKMEEGTAKAKTAPATASTRTSKMSKKANY